jgi:hypothetical protein
VGGEIRRTSPANQERYKRQTREWSVSSSERNCNTSQHSGQIHKNKVYSQKAMGFEKTGASTAPLATVDPKNKSAKEPPNH